MRTLKTLPDVVDWGLCTGCGACAYACKDAGVRMVHVPSEGFRPLFEDPASPQLKEALEICPGARIEAHRRTGKAPRPTAADHEFGPTMEIWEGWASDPHVRLRGSSGGLLTALSLYCTEVAGFAGVIHSGMDPARPWMNMNHLSRTRQEVVARTGSRYSPTAPCAALAEVRPGTGPYVFIGKPCDTAAVAALGDRDPNLAETVGVLLSFFCAGTPSTRGTLQLLEQLGIERSGVTELHYRGDGWPGNFRVTERGEAAPKTLSYQQSWGLLTAHRPLRCNLCPDGLGRVADISCGDAWEEHGRENDPGRSIILVRTEKGRRILAGAARAGYITIERVGAESVLRAQPNLLARRRTLFGRLLALQVLGVPVPRYVGFSLFRSWIAVGALTQIRSVAGTLRRAMRHRWFRRRPLSAGIVAGSLHV